MFCKVLCLFLVAELQYDLDKYQLAFGEGKALI